MIQKLRTLLTPWWIRPLLAISAGLWITFLVTYRNHGTWEGLAKQISVQIAQLGAPSQRTLAHRARLEELQKTMADARAAAATPTTKRKSGARSKSKVEPSAAQAVTEPAPDMAAKVPEEQKAWLDPHYLMFGFGALVTCCLWLALSAFAGKLYRRRLARAALAARQAAQRQREAILRHNEKVERYRAQPLSDHTLCTACGWLGRFTANTPTFNGTKSLGTAAAVGGTGLAAVGCGGSTLGIILIVIGIPLLFLACIGIIPILIGAILLLVGGVSTTAGATVAASGASAAAGASNTARRAAAAPNQCPQCKNVGLIPALSPMGVNQIQNTPTVTMAAEAEAKRIIESLPKLLDMEGLPELSG